MTEQTQQAQAKVGAIVSDFEMDVFDPVRNDFGKISLSDLKEQGKWTILVFYPADYTFVCPTELADVAKVNEKLTEIGATVISVSTDTKYVHMAWQREESLLKNVRYLMGADPTGKASRLFGVYDEGTGLALRGTFLISPEGRLVSSEIHFYNVGRNASELLRKAKANVYLADHPEEACPANWNDGQKTLKPGAELVGRVGKALVS
ncbi:MAG: redoxin domain-containing protein [Elusimicrobia bacterium]|nr:redoxin domain-containing protein [Elusimicrobiota bacterium]